MIQKNTNAVSIITRVSNIFSEWKISAFSKFSNLMSLQILLLYIIKKILDWYKNNFSKWNSYVMELGNKKHEEALSLIWDECKLKFYNIII